MTRSIHMSFFGFLTNFRFVLESTFSNFIKRRLISGNWSYVTGILSGMVALLRGGGLPFLGVDSWLAAASNVPPGWTKCFLEALYLHIL